MRLLCLHYESSFLASCVCECPAIRELHEGIAREYRLLLMILCHRGTERRSSVLGVGSRGLLVGKEHECEVLMFEAGPACSPVHSCSPLSIFVLFKRNFLNEN